MIYGFIIIAFLLFFGVIRFIIRWNRSRRLRAPLTVLQLVGLTIRKTPLDEFIEIYARLLCADLISPWDPGLPGPHPLERVSLAGGSMAAVAEQWKRTCEGESIDISFDEFVKATLRNASSRCGADVETEVIDCCRPK